MDHSKISACKSRGVSIISYPLGTAFTVPISNLTSVLSAITETYVILGTCDPIHFRNLSNSAHVYSIPYKFESSIVKQAFRYTTLQAKLSLKLLTSRKDSRKIIFFTESCPIILMIIAKVANYSVYWLLPSYISLLSTSISSRLNTILSKACYNLCNGIILYSPCLVSYWNLEKYRDKVLVAHEHFLDFSNLTITTPVPDRSRLIGYIGRLSREKGVENFIRALPTILSNQQDLQVLIGGDGELSETIEASLQEEGITDRVDFPGWICHDDLPRYLNQLRLLVLPSYTEGLPNIALEAMACGTPVLTTPVGAITDIILDGKTGFIMEDNTPECIAANVLRALNSPELEQIAENGRQFARENFTFEKTVNTWKRILQESR